MKKLSLSLVALIVLQIAAFATSANSATVKFDQAVIVGTSTLRAGEYKVTSTDAGIEKKNADTRIFTATAGSGKVLQGIDPKNASLTFAPAGK